jgi:Family of unknown function (DUF6410)
MNYAEVRVIGRSLRVATGVLLLWLIWTRNSALATRPLAVVGYLLVVLAVYVAFLLALGERFLAKIHPWLGAAVLTLPIYVVLGLAALGLVDYAAQFALFAFLGISLLLAGLSGYGGCETLAIPNLLLNKRYNVACILFSPLDWVEYKLWERMKRG